MLSADDGVRLANTWFQDVPGCAVSQRLALCGMQRKSPPDTMWPVAATKRLLDTGADNARHDHESKRHQDSPDSARRLAANDDTVPMAQEPFSGSGVKRSNLEAIRRADAEAEIAMKRAKMLEERRAAKRASATPMDELKESATHAEITAEAMLVAAEAAVTETRETIEALTVSGLQQAHEMSYHAETTAESFFQAHNDMTVTSKEQTRQKKLDFLESMKVYEEVYEDDLPAGTHVMSGRWVDAMKTPTVWRSKYTARGYEEPQSDEGCFAATATVQGIRVLLARCLDKRDQGHEAFVADYAQPSLNAEVREGDQLHEQPPEGWNPKILMDDRRVVWKVHKAMLGLRTSPRRWQEHLSSKLKEHGFIQDERDLFLFANTELDICIGAHVDDMLAVEPNELAKNLLQELAKHMAMRWSMVTDKPQEFLGRSLCKTPQGYKFGVSCDNVTKLCKDFGFGELKGSNTLSFEKPDDNDTILDKSGQRLYRQLLGGLLWLDRPDIKNAVCHLPAHVGTATNRDEVNIKRLLRYLIGNPACNMIVGCNLDVPGIAGTPQGSVVVMTDADWAEDVKERSSQPLWNCSLGQRFC